MMDGFPAAGALVLVVVMAGLTLLLAPSGAYARAGNAGFSPRTMIILGAVVGGAGGVLSLTALATGRDALLPWGNAAATFGLLLAAYGLAKRWMASRARNGGQGHD